MGRLIRQEVENWTWGLASCLLFIGISRPAYRKFYQD